MTLTLINRIINDIYNKFYTYYFKNLLNLTKLKDKADDNYLNYKITEIYNIVMPIFSLYQSLDKKFKKNNLNIHICFLISKYLFFIYANYIIFNDSKSSKFYLKNIIKQYNYDIFPKLSKNIPPYLLHLNNYYIDNIQHNPNYIVPNNVKDIISSKENMIEYIKYYIYYINNIYIKPNIKNKYMTIPQYKNICWFIAILTGITYSDNSKKLLLNNPTSRINNKYQEFNDFIFYIIDNISATYRIYNEKIEYDCKILKELKKKPIKLIIYLIINYIKNNENKCIESLLKIIKLAIINNFSKKIKYYRDEIIKSYDYNYFLCKFISHLPLNIFTEFIKLLNIKNLNDFNNNKKTLKKLLKLRIKEYYNKFKISRNYGLGSKEIDIISFFYEILNIKNLCCKCYKIDNIIYTNYIKGDIDLPDIILLEFIEKPNEKKNKQLNIKLNSNEIFYNNNKYKLDYIITSNNTKLSCYNCGHVICGIHYNKKQYFYNTSSQINSVKCNDNDNDNDNVYIPCFLIKHNWTKDIFTNVYYKIQKCNYIKIKPSTIYELDNIIEQNIYFKFNSDIVCVYVKI
jgi:hypothetical protein